MPVQYRNGIDLLRTALIQAVLHPVTVDPSSSVDGQIWYRTDTDRFRVRANGVTQDVAFLTDVTAGSITGNLWDAQTVVIATADNTPFAQTIAENQVLGRPAGGNLGALSAAQLRAIVNVENGATADQTAAEILTALLTVDGPGSGLDADTLDGTQLSALATIAYVDAAVNGLAWKDSVRVATAGNITLSGTQTIDGVAVVAGNRVLVKNQTTASANGIYVAAAGAWTRATDADSSGDLVSAAVFVSEGGTQADTAWIMTTNEAITVGSTALTWTQFGAGTTYTAGAGLALTGNVFSVATGGVTDAMLTSTFVKKHAATIGNGSATVYTVTHNLATTDVTVTLWDANASPTELIMADVTITNANSVSITFGAAPLSNSVRVVVTG